MTNRLDLVLVIILIVSFSGCKMKSYLFSTEIAGSTYEIIISSKKKPLQTEENTFFVHPQDHILIKQPCGFEDFDPIIIKGEFSLGMAEEWGSPYITRNNSIYFCTNDFACPEMYSDSVYHWTNRFYLQIRGCLQNTELGSSGLIFNVSQKIAFCK